MVLDKDVWMRRMAVLLYSGVFASIGNWINTSKSGNPVYPHQIIPALLMLFAVIVVGCLIDEFLKATLKLNLPNIIYISTLAIIVGIPGFPGAEYFVSSVSKIGLLPLCTPILAYAGISLGKDLGEFKKQGVAIVCVGICTFFGTYVGSALIAHVVLKMTGQI